MIATGPRNGWTFEYPIHFRNAAKGRKRLREGAAPPPVPVIPGAVPRVARLVALAHRWQGLVERGDVADYADLARLAGVTRQRITQIMNLLQLAPDIQEAVLDLPRTLAGRDPVLETDVRPIAAVPEWTRQRAMWRELTKRASARSPA